MAISNGRRILHLIHTPRFSGAEILVRDLTLFQKDRAFSGIAAFSPAEPAFQSNVDQLVDGGVALYFPDTSLGRWGRVKHFRSAFGHFKPTIIFAHSVLPALYGRLALPLRVPRPLFVPVLHSGTNDDFSDISLRLSEVFLSRRADYVVAVSTKGAEMYERRIPNAKKVVVIPNGINISLFKGMSNRRTELRTSLGLHAQDKLVLQVGRLSEVKQQLLTLESFMPLIQAQSNVHLWFAGAAEELTYEARLRTKIDESGVSQRVRLLGSRDDTPSLLASADLFVMPSLHEAQSIAMIEALASGVAVVGSDIPSFQFALKYEGVYLRDRYAPFVLDEIREVLYAERRFNRDLSELDITRTSESYLELVDSLGRGPVSD